MTSRMTKTLVAAATVGATVAWAAVADENAKTLEQLNAEDLAQTVRPGGVNGQPFWNGNAIWFLYAPSFDFPVVKGALAYRFRVFDKTGRAHDFEADSPTVSLAKVWSELPTGKVDVWCEAHGKFVTHVLKRSFRSFWKMEPFRPGAYAKPPRSFGEAAKLGYEWMLNMPALKTFAETGRPGDYGLNCYPSKMHAATVRAMVAYAGKCPERREAALKLARAAADYLILVAQPEGAPLAGFTPTYEGRQGSLSATYGGQNMLYYPCVAGIAFHALYKATGDAKYLCAAERIADSYVRLQGEDGTWYLKIWEKTGEPVNPNRLSPHYVIDMMDILFAETGKAEYRRCADRAFGFIERGPLEDWNWEAQFEDVEPTEKYINLTHHASTETAMRLLRCWPDDPKRVDQARDLLRYSEDQFVGWRMPFSDPQVVMLRTGKWEHWIAEPAVFEQYRYPMAVDSSSARLIRTYLAFYRAKGNPLDLEKAKALGGALVKAQDPDGRIPTLLTQESRECLWLNCMAESLQALGELAELTEK